MQHIPRILALDGGGVRGLSSLLILQKLMSEIQRLKGESQPPLPCQHFDLICGTSTGGLIAIMLGRLRMPVEQCIKAYMKLSKRVFRIDNVIKGVPIGSDQCRFDEEPLEKALKEIIKEYTGNENSTMADPNDQGCDFCPVFVTATEGENAGGPVKLFRSYGFQKDHCPIWQAARATSAAPSYFRPAWVQIPDPGGWYIDGGLRCNNPSEEALKEARKYWTNVKQVCIVSIGTGVQKTVNFIQGSMSSGDMESEESDGDENIPHSEGQTSSPSTSTSLRTGTRGSAISTVRLNIGSVMSTIPLANNIAKLSRIPGGIQTLKRFSLEIVKLSTESEDTHLRMCERASNSNDRFPYYRFNIPTGMEQIGLQEWKKTTTIGALTRGYLTNPCVETEMEECAKNLCNLASIEGIQKEEEIIEASEPENSPKKTNGREIHGSIGYWISSVIVILVFVCMSFARHKSNSVDNDLGSRVINNDISSPTHFLVPEENKFFVGRTSLLGEIFDKLQDSKPRQYNHRAALYGLGGVGKSQLALRYVYWKKDYYSSIFWISGVELEDGFKKIAVELELQSEHERSIREIVLRWFENHKGWLLVVDNLDEVGVVWDYLPTNDGQGHILITTRNSLAFSIDAVNIEVDVLDRNESVELLLLLSNSPSMLESAPNKTVAEKIVSELGYLPLAIELAAAYIRENSRTLEEYLSIYRSTAQKLYSWNSVSNRKYNFTISTVWAMSFAQVRQNEESLEAAQLLQLFAFLNPDNISIDFILAGRRVLKGTFNNLLDDDVEFEFDNALRVLKRFSLIKHISNQKAVSIHRLVQETIQKNMTEEERLKWWHLVANLCNEAFLGPTEDGRKISHNYQHQVLIPLFKIPDLKSEPLYDVLCRVAIFQMKVRNFEQSTKFFEKALRILSAIREIEEPKALQAMPFLAMSYMSSGKWLELVLLIGKMIARGAEVGAVDVVLRAKVLAAMFCSKAGYNDVMVPLELIVNISMVWLGNQHDVTIFAMDALIDTYWNEGRRDDAMDLLETVVAARRAKYGMRNFIIIINQLARAYADQRGLEAAVNQMKFMARPFGVTYFGNGHSQTVTESLGLTELYIRQERMDVAIKTLGTAMENLNPGPEALTPDGLRIARRLLWLLREGSWDRIVESMVLEGERTFFGEWHQETFDVIAVLTPANPIAGHGKAGEKLAEKIKEGCLHPDGSGEFTCLTLGINQKLTEWGTRSGKGFRSPIATPLSDSGTIDGLDGYCACLLDIRWEKEKQRAVLGNLF